MKIKKDAEVALDGGVNVTEEEGRMGRFAMVIRKFRERYPFDREYPPVDWPDGYQAYSTARWHGESS